MTAEPPTDPTRRESPPPPGDEASSSPGRRLLSLELRSDPSTLAAARKAIERAISSDARDSEEASASLRLEPECRSRLVLATIEALTNVMRHAYDGRVDGPIELHVTEHAARSSDAARRPCIEIELLDRGEHVPPCDRKGRALDDVEPGGLGTHLIEACTDQIECRARPGGGSILVLRKFASDDSSAEEPREEGPH